MTHPATLVYVEIDERADGTDPMTITTLAAPAQWAPDAPETEACTECGLIVDTATVDTPPAGCDTGVLCDTDLDEHIRSCWACSAELGATEDIR